jgi:hypothetical protein
MRTLGAHFARVIKVQLYLPTEGVRLVRIPGALIVLALSATSRQTLRGVWFSHLPPRRETRSKGHLLSGAIRLLAPCMAVAWARHPTRAKILVQRCGKWAP